MSGKSVQHTPLQYIGLGLFLIAFVIFNAVLVLDNYRLPLVDDKFPIENEYHREYFLEAAEKSGLEQATYKTTFAYTGAVESTLSEAMKALQEEYDRSGLPEGIEDEWEYKIGDWKIDEYKKSLTLASATGPVAANPWLWWMLSIGLGILGGLLYILPKFSTHPGIKHDHIFHSNLTKGLTLSVRSILLGATILGVLAFGVYYHGNWLWPAVTAGVALLITALVFFVQQSIHNSPQRSASPQGLSAWIGLFFGIYLILFYILLYWYPAHLTGWMTMSTPLSKMLSGNVASNWFVYGMLYTIVILVMGVRMFTKYQHNRYQQLRTASVMFFQTAIAFIIPEILVRLNKPYYDFKNIWPLDYDFFFNWNLEELTSSGAFGIFILVWGIALIVVAVPVLVYFFGKRWYCSWVCGCGGLAETLGDPYRQLSDKSLRAWKFERYIIHGVLVFAVVMTLMVLYHYFSGSTNILGLSSDNVRSWYGFLIGSAFAGVVGTGFYPLMGNRVWCRFGCPLAAYLGLVQKFKSRFRITTNGGQCISCGNCSTYCEMGIDVRWYAQRGQDIVRSSCVGCGVCSAVCPRGVLRLENGDGSTVDTRAQELRTVHVREDQIGIL